MGLWVLGLLACGGAEEPGQEPATVAAPGAPVRFRLVSPGAKERWATEGGDTVTFDRTSSTLTREGFPELEARRRWPALGTLALCLGADPLADPLPADPGAFRALVWHRAPRWHLTLSGMNRCSLEGELVLDAVADTVDPLALTVDGQLWATGGRQRARAILAANIRAEAEGSWPDLDVPGRIRLLQALAVDPEPEAAAVLNRLLLLAGPQRGDVQAALDRRTAIGPAEAPGSDR